MISASTFSDLLWASRDVGEELAEAIPPFLQEVTPASRRLLERLHVPM